MTVDVTVRDGRCRAVVAAAETELPCCEAGHPDPAEAARHAWGLTRALARKTAG